MLENVQRMPEHKRQRLLWAIIIGALVILSLLWIVTSQIPRHPKRPAAFFTDIKDKINKAKADFPR